MTERTTNANSLSPGAGEVLRWEKEEVRRRSQDGRRCLATSTAHRSVRGSTQALSQQAKSLNWDEPPHGSNYRPIVSFLGSHASGSQFESRPIDPWP